MTRTLLLVGTRKGAFILDGGRDRTAWSVSEPLCEGWPIHDLQWDDSTGSIYAGGGSSWYGPAVFRTDDLGKTWTHSSEGMTYGDDGEKIPTVWNVTPAHGSIYAGVEPAGPVPERRRRQDVDARLRPARPPEPAGPGLVARRRRPDLPHDRPPPDRRRPDVDRDQRGRHVRDGGRRGDAGRRGTSASPPASTRIPYPETGQCVHKLVMAAGDPDRLYQQNHCGVYRSADGGRTLGGRSAPGCRRSSGSSWAPIRATRRRPG